MCRQSAVSNHAVVDGDATVERAIQEQPLSLALSPLVPRRERGLDSVGVAPGLRLRGALDSLVLVVSCHSLCNTK